MNKHKIPEYVISHRNPDSGSIVNKQKISLVYKNDDNEIEIESVWAAKEGDFYRIDNIPFFAANLALGDLVSVENDNGELYFDELIEPSGHSVIQIVFFKEAYLEEVTQKLMELGCNWEGSHMKSLISVDIPGDVDYQKVKTLLEDQYLPEQILDYREACLGNMQ